VLDDFRVKGRPFGPHPHAGLSAVSYVFEDSPGALRSSDSLGNSIVMGPGGIVWAQAGAGMMHEEIPAVRHLEVHGLQIFVNLSAKNKSVTPRVLQLAGQDVPVWGNPDGDRVRVVVGSFEGVLSPLVPAEPFHLLDVELRRRIAFPLEKDHNVIVNVLAGSVRVSADGRELVIPARHGMALHGEGQVSLRSDDHAHLLLLSGAAINEPLVTNGPFIMNNRSQLEAAFRRFQAGEMGHLEPYPEG
jgi:redox-sensitive bicupin YhaK (pirin superfamily)